MYLNNKRYIIQPFGFITDIYISVIKYMNYVALVIQIREHSRRGA